MRFVDGDLPPDEQSSMAAEIARDPDLAKRLEAFRFTREELVDAYAPTLKVPRELMERFLGPDAASAPPHNRAKLSPAAISVLKRMNLSRQVVAMAAGAALLLAGCCVMACAPTTPGSSRPHRFSEPLTKRRAGVPRRSQGICQ